MLTLLLLNKTLDIQAMQLKQPAGRQAIHLSTHSRISSAVEPFTTIIIVKCNYGYLLIVTLIRITKKKKKINEEISAISLNDMNQLSKQWKRRHEKDMYKEYN
uniref:Uncharacterized protein n=1 Tax=Glossina pallidipes TaxID=7398 RepID=A0A1A9Z3G1_GLOPL